MARVWPSFRERHRTGSREVRETRSGGSRFVLAVGGDLAEAATGPTGPAFAAHLGRSHAKARSRETRSGGFGFVLAVGGGLAEAATGPSVPPRCAFVGRGLTRRREAAKRGLGAAASCWQCSAKARSSQQGASAPRPRFAPPREITGHASRPKPDLVSLRQGVAGTPSRPRACIQNPFRSVKGRSTGTVASAF